MVTPSAIRTQLRGEVKASATMTHEWDTHEAA